MHLKLAKMRVVLASFCGIAAITLVCFRFLPASPTTVALLLLLAVLITAIKTSLQSAIVAAFAATFCLDFFFFPPVGSITIFDPQNWIALLVFCLISLIAGRLSNQLRAQRDRVVEQQHEEERLHSLSRSLLLTNTEDDVRRLVVNDCTRLFDFDEFALFESLHKTFYRSSTTSSFPEEAMRTAAQRSSVHVNGADWNIVPISLGHLPFGSIAYVRRSPLPAATLNALASTIALGLAQVQAQEAANRAQAIRRSEELKSVMIDALAHDLKTPLTSIEAAADMLAGAGSLSPAQTADMVAVIQEETRGLRRLVDEATHLARIDAKRLKLNLKPESMANLMKAAIQSLGEKTSTHEISMNIPSSLPPVFADSELITQALKQLIDNALKYGPQRSVVTVAGTEADGVITIAVRDRGPGLTELEQSKIFEKFYRGRYDRSAIQGTGMGLSIAREIVEAHGGSIGVRSYPGQGTEFFVSLKSAAWPIVVQQDAQQDVQQDVQQDIQQEMRQ